MTTNGTHYSLMKANNYLDAESVLFWAFGRVLIDLFPQNVPYAKLKACWSRKCISCS